MLYLAILLILIGLFFLWKAFQEPSKEFPGKARLQTAPRVRKSRVRGHANKNGEREDAEGQKQERSQMRLDMPPESASSYGSEDSPSERAGKKALAKVDLEIEGALYMDRDQNSRRLYTNKGSLAMHAYSGIHRIGRARLSAQADVILFQSANVSYNYAARDLDQIIFQEKGIALIPYSLKQAAAIFLSSEVFRFKDYIKNYSSQNHFRDL